MSPPTTPPARPAAPAIGPDLGQRLSTLAPPASASPPAPPGGAAAAAQAGLREGNTPAAQALSLVHAAGCTRQQRETAAETLLRAYGGEILRHCRGLPLEDAEEVMQDAVMKFIDTRKVRADTAKPQAYFRQIYRNLTASRGRERVRDAALFEHPAALPGDGESTEAADSYAHLADEPNRADPAERAAQRELLQRVQAALYDPSRNPSDDPDKDARLMEMFAVQTPIQEIAHTLDISEGATRDRIYRVRLVLRALFSSRTK